MAKRFIDTEMFDDDWFMDLSKDAKIFYVYLFTKCNHAGILKLNSKLAKYQTGVSSVDSVIEQLGNRCVTVTEGLVFLPKFIKFQYPNFPNSRVKQQESALKILTDLDIDFNNYLTLKQELPNPYDSDNDNVNEVYIYARQKEFYDKQLELSNKETVNIQFKEKYQMFVDYIFGKNATGKSVDAALGFKDQIKYDDFKKLTVKSQQTGKSISDTLDLLINTPKYAKGKTNLYLTLNNWLGNKY